MGHAWDGGNKSGAGAEFGFVVLDALADFVELGDLLLCQRTLAAELFDDQCDLGEVLNGFHVHVGRHQVAAVGDHAVVGHEDGVVIGDIGLQRLGKFGGSRSGVMGKGNGTEREQNFTDKGLIESESAGGEAGGRGRVSMHDGVYVAAHAIDGHVHADLTGDVAEAGDLAAVHVDDEQVVDRHHALTDAGRRNQNRTFVETERDVTVRGGNQAALVQQLAEAENFKPGFVVAHRKFNPEKKIPSGRIVP